MKIHCAVGPFHDMRFDPSRRPELEALDAALAAGIAERDADR